MDDYVPHKEGEFDGWQGNLVDAVTGNSEAWNIPQTAVDKLVNRSNEWKEAYARTKVKNTRTAADVTAKNTVKKVYISELRIFVKRYLAYEEVVSDAHRRAMGLTVPSSKHSEAPVPSTTPVCVVDFSVHQQHSVKYRDSKAEGRGKPRGVHGCEFWIKKGGDAPESEAELVYSGMTTRAPYIMKFAMSDVGITVHYWARWVNTRGEHGPWSDGVSAVVA